VEREHDGRDSTVNSADTDFEEFVSARGQRLLKVAWLLTGDAHLAEDLLQTVLAKVWPKWRSIAGGNPEAYVRKALVNTHLSWWQRRWRGEVPHAHRDLTALAGHRAAGVDPFASVDLEQSLSDVIRLLPPRQRAVVILRYFEDLSVEETAQVLGCRPGTVRSQASKALAMLRTKLVAVPNLVESGERHAQRA
jgi:RNA polymerase sigma-70 factor (sigma-E family)